MRASKNELSQAVRLALTLGAAATAAVAAPMAFAQEEGEESTRLETITVTGSRIKRADIETASPVVVIERSDLQASGLQTVGDVIRNLTQADSLGLTNLTNDTNANDGTQTVSLRGLGAARTLILVNGRRWLALGTGAVDTSTIPTAAIQRVEVLTDGASAIYGSDAIGGVINIILRDNYEGAELEVFYGENSEGDGEQSTVNLTLGTTSERGSVLFNISKTEFDPIFAGDREISAVPVFGVPQALGSAFGQFGFFSVPRSAVPHLNLPAGGNVSVGLNPAREGAGNRVASDFVLFSDALRYNFAPVNYLFTPSDRLSAYTQASYQVTDSIRFFSQFNYAQRKSVTRIAEVPLTVNPTGLRGPQWAFTVAANNVFNPFGVALPGDVGYRMSAAGPRTNIQNFDQYSALIGFDGAFDLFDRPFSWDVYYQRGEASRSFVGLNYVNLVNLSRGLGPSFRDAAGVARCGVPGAVVAGCVPVNLFNGVTGMTPEMVRYITYTLVGASENDLTNWGANLTGDIVELPAGPLAFAAGIEYRRTGLDVTQDPLVSGGFSSNNFTENTSGGITVEEAYLELAVPVLRDLPFAERLELQLAGRTSDYVNSGLIGPTPVEREFDADNYKYGFTWKPFADLLVRGNYADTFRAPPITALFGGGAEGFPQALDPCSSTLGNPYAGLTAEQRARCTSQGVPVGGAPQATSQLRALSGGNPFLNPESGRTKTLGLVYSPGFLEGFDVSLDWYEIFLKEGLAARGAQGILDGCIRNGDATDCLLIERTGTGQVSTVRTGNFNLASIEIEGYDLVTNYRFDTDFGRFQLGWNNSYTASAKVTTGSLSAAQQLAGRAIGAFGDASWRHRSTATLNWTYGDWGVTYGARYLSPLIEECQAFVGFFAAGLSTRQLCSEPVRFVNSATGVPTAAARNRIGSHTYHDVQVSYNTPFDGTIRVGARNLFDKQPGFSVSTFANSFLDGYDIPGVFWYVGYTQKF
jgi:outer membrane receptor protein involved in Fe transport